MGRPTPEELAARRQRMAAVNDMGRGGSALPPTKTTGSPALTGQSQSVTGVNTQQAALAGGNQPRTELPASGSGAVANASRTPVEDAAQTTQPGAGNPPINTDALLANHGPAERTFTTDWVDKQGPGTALRNMETAHSQVLNIIDKGGEQAVIAADELATGMGIKDDMTADELKKRFQMGFEEVTADRVETGEMTAAQKKKQDKQVTKLFGGMTKQELGLFLFQYGTAMMGASDLGTAFGRGGTAAYAGLQERRRYREQMEVEGAERTRKADLEERRVGALEGRLEMDEDAAKRKPPDMLATDQGLFEWLPEEGRYSDKPKLGPDGKPLMPSSLTTRPGVKSWEIQQWMDAYGVTEQQATNLALSGVKPAEAELEAKKNFDASLRAGYVFIPGKGRVSARNITPDDRAAYIKDWVLGQYGPGAGGALTTNSGSGGGALAGTKRSEVEKKYPRPEGMSDSEYNEYIQIQEQLED